MINVLSIGNSFSQDAHRYIKKLADASGVKLYNENLYIGGCTLSAHALNLKENNAAYSLERHGEATSRYVSIYEALTSRKWDVITLQQASHLSVDFGTYEPHLSYLAKEIRKTNPDAKIALHETWAYENGKEKLLAMERYSTSEQMFTDVRSAYDTAKTAIGADILIPSGEIMQSLSKIGHKMYRDGFHASLGLGRYALGLIWIKTIFGTETAPKEEIELDEDVSKEVRILAEKTADEILKLYNNAN